MGRLTNRKFSRKKKTATKKPQSIHDLKITHAVAPSTWHLRLLENDIKVQVPKVFMDLKFPTAADQKLTNPFLKMVPILLKRNIGETLVPQGVPKRTTDSTGKEYDLFPAYLLGKPTLERILIHFKKNDQMIAPALIACMKAKISGELYVTKFKQNRENAKSHLSLSTIEAATQFIKDVIHINGKMNKSPHLETSERSQWMTWSTWGSRFESDIMS